MDVCKRVVPQLLPTPSGHHVACHLIHPPEKSIAAAKAAGDETGGVVDGEMQEGSRAAVS
jgi:hypothetical protein